MFTISKKDNRANERVLNFSDYTSNENEDSIAMFYCSHI